MENKNVGFILIAISILLIVIIFLFNSALNDFVESSCTLAHGGDYCPMYDTITKQTYFAIIITAIILISGLFLVFSRPNERIIVKKIKGKIVKKKFDISMLKNDEKSILKIIEQDKTIFQADLIEKSGFSKVKVSRILDRLEGQGMIERKRRGMTNVVVFRE